MGKKSKKSRTKVATSSVAGSPSKDVLELVSSLTTLCEEIHLKNSSAPPPTQTQKVEQFKAVHEIIEQIRLKQQSCVRKFAKREESMKSFRKWVRDNGVDMSAVSIDVFEKEGYGLRATRDLREGELFLEIPRKLMMTVNDAYESCLGNLIEEDRILGSMPTVLLAMYLLCEAHKPMSQYAPYIDILPSRYNTPLYYTYEDIMELKSSPVQGEAIKQYNQMARQFAHFYTLLSRSRHAQNLPFKSFCYDDYRWAVSTVTTRNNHIPMLDNSDAKILALIPLWDLCNHAAGYISTGYNAERDCVESSAMRQYRKYDQIYIFYGRRSNSEFLLHNGFYYPNNEYDRFELQLGYSRSDRLFPLKVELLAKLTMVSPRIFYLEPGEEPFSSELLAFMRIFHMNEDELKEYLVGKNSKRLASLREFGTYVSSKNELDVWNYLQTRTALLQKAYPTSLDEDVEMVKSHNATVSQRRYFIMMERISEKKILGDALQFCKQQIENLKSVNSQAAASNIDVEHPSSESQTAKVQSSQDTQEVITDGSDINSSHSSGAPSAARCPSSANDASSQLSNSEAKAHPAGVCNVPNDTNTMNVGDSSSSNTDVAVNANTAHGSADIASSSCSSNSPSIKSNQQDTVNDVADDLAGVEVL